MTLPHAPENAPSPADTGETFWGRQFDADGTVLQLVVDIAFGILLPLICLLADPVVFDGQALLRSQRMPCLLIIVGEMVLLAIWLAFGSHLPRLAPMFAGAFLTGTWFAAGLGVLLLPLSLVGLVFLSGVPGPVVLVGVLGFSPLLSGFVFLRQTVRSFRLARRRWTPAWLACVSLSVTTVVIAGPFVMNNRLNRRMDAVVSDLHGGNPAEVQRAAESLHRFRWFVDADRIVSTYIAEKDPQRKQALADLYSRTTHKDIDDRVRVLQD